MLLYVGKSGCAASALSVFLDEGKRKGLFLFAGDLLQNEIVSPIIPEIKRAESVVSDRA